MTSIQRGALGAAIIGSATVFLDGTIVNIALPRIGATLPAVSIGVLEGQVYVVAGYMATLAAFLLVAGALGDRYGRRRIFVIGLGGFGLASILCGLTPTLDILAVARLLQGVAGALLVPGSLAIITAMFDGAQRARAFGIWASATSGLAIVGPPIGGALVEAFGWRSIFLINVPLVAVGLVLAIRYVPEMRTLGERTRFDWVGAVVGIVAIGGLAFGAIRGQQVAWAEPGPLVTLGIGALALVAFPILMVKRGDPLVPPSLFRNRTFTAINLSTLLIYGALYVLLYVQSLFLQGVLRYSPLATAIIGLPSGLALVFLSAYAGTLAGRYGARPFLVGGPLIMFGGVLWWLRVPATSTAWLARIDQPTTLIPPLATLTDPLPAIVLFGIGISMVVAPLTSTLMSSVPVERAGLASAINNALSRVGQPLLSAGIFILITDRFYASLASRVPGLDPASPDLRGSVQPLNAPGAGVDAAIADAARLASAEAFHATILVVAALLLGGAIVNWIGLRSGTGLAGTSGGDSRASEDIRADRADGTGRARRPGMTARDWDARTYDRIADPMHRWGLEVLHRLPLRGDERVLDAGCGSGRVTEALAERLPGGRVVALDASPAMLDEARRRLARFGDRIEYVQADLGSPLPVEGTVDAILSTATFHWVPDHDALFRNLAALVRPGGRLVAQCGGVGNIESLRRVVRTIGDGFDAARNFASPLATVARLEAGGFANPEVWLSDAPTRLEPGVPLETYLETVCLREHVARLPEAERAGFVHAVATRLPEPVLDYVRLNIVATRRA